MPLPLVLLIDQVLSFFESFAIVDHREGKVEVFAEEIRLVQALLVWPGVFSQDSVPFGLGSFNLIDQGVDPHRPVLVPDD